MEAAWVEQGPLFTPLLHPPHPCRTPSHTRDAQTQAVTSTLSFHPETRTVLGSRAGEVGLPRLPHWRPADSRLSPCFCTPAPHCSAPGVASRGGGGRAHPLLAASPSPREQRGTQGGPGLRGSARTDCGRRAVPNATAPCPRPGHRRPPLPGLGPLFHLAPLLHFPVPSASRVVVSRSGSNLGKRRRRRRRGVPGRGLTPLRPRPAGGVAAGVVALPARPSPSPLPPPPCASLVAPPADPRSQAGIAGEGETILQVREPGEGGARCGKGAKEEPGVRRRPRWSGAQSRSVRSPSHPPRRPSPTPWDRRRS